MKLSMLPFLPFLLACATAAPSLADSFQVGTGRQAITPEEPMWMAGYAARSAPSDGKLHELWAKALAVEDAQGRRAVLVSTDLIGVTTAITEATASLVEERVGIPRERFLLTASHTHCGPVVRDSLLNMYGLDDEQLQRMDAYSAGLPERILAAVEMAVNDLEPATLHWGNGTAGFAGNRRSYTLGGLSNAHNPIGPVDHDVPVLLARNAEGAPKGVLFGYACHNTTLDIQQFNGDYAGFAQIAVEEALPGATALFVAGCGGDQNPYPRREIAYAERHGEELAEGVLDAVESELTLVEGPLRAVFEEIALPLSTPPTREQLEADLDSSNVYVQRRARHLLRRMEAEDGLPDSHPYPIQVWQFGDTLQITALGGEVVVDYALRLKHELGRDKQFIIAYANDTPGYIPSLRILREGGYEGEGAMLYYGLWPWAPTVEETIIEKVHELSARE